MELVELKCKNCGAPLDLREYRWWSLEITCPYCDKKFLLVKTNGAVLKEEDLVQPIERPLSI